MSATAYRETKPEIINDFRTHDNDTGSPEVQVALLSNRIAYLTDHFKSHAKDHHSRRGLLMLGGAETTYGITEAFVDVPQMRGVYAPTPKSPETSQSSANNLAQPPHMTAGRVAAQGA